MKFVHTSCGNNIGEECSRRGHQFLDINYHKTMNCVEDSFSDYGNLLNQNMPQSNSLIDEDVAAWISLGTMKYPALTINNVNFRG
jgi:hypothetical protein